MWGNFLNGAIFCCLDQPKYMYNKMKPSLFYCVFLVVYALASVLANDSLAGSTLDSSVKDNSTNKDMKMLVCILSS